MIQVHPRDHGDFQMRMARNNDLVLHIYKDEDFDISKGDDFNIVSISTAQNGRWVDDSGDVYVTDGSLYRELERINDYKKFSTY